MSKRISKRTKALDAGNTHELSRKPAPAEPISVDEGCGLTAPTRGA
jgi:hypothetical protein